MAEARKGPDVLSLTGTSAMILALCAGAVGAYRVWQLQPIGWPAYYLVLSIPAAAVVVYMLVSLFVPSLFAQGQLSFPATLTLPLVFDTFLLMVNELRMSIGSSLERPNEVLAILGIWERWPTLLAVVVLQVIGLTLTGRMGR